MLVIHSCTTPYVVSSTPPIQRHRKCRNTRGARNQMHGSCPLQLPNAVGKTGTTRGGPNAPPAIKLLSINAITKPTSSGSASALPGNVAGDRVPICTRYRSRPPPGSPLRLPGKFQMDRMGRSRDTLKLHAYFEHAASATELYVCLSYYIHNIYYFLQVHV
jgi:hypothetical protein